MKGFFDGITSYFSAVSIIRKYGLWSYFIIPGLIISIVLFCIILALIWFYADNLGGLAIAIFSWVPWDWLQQTITKAAPVIGAVMIGGVAFILYKYLLFILLAPFMSPLSEKVEQNLKGPSYISRGFSIKQAFRDMIRGIRLSLRNLIRELFFVILISLLALVPLINFGAAALIFLVQAYYAGFGNMDFTLERYYGVRDSVRFVRQNRGLAIGNGMIFLILLMIPVFGTLIAPPLATVAATRESLVRIGVI